MGPSLYHGIRIDTCKPKIGVMVETETINYYGILEYVVKLLYMDMMPVVLFKCKWYDTDPSKSGSTKLDHGLLSVDTNSSWYEDYPFCLATTTRQVFNVDDPKAGETWKVVNVMSHRNVYNAKTLAVHDDEPPPTGNQVEESYQESFPVYSGVFDLNIDIGNYQLNNAITPWLVNEDDDGEEEEEEEEDEEEEEEEDDEEEIIR